MGWFGKKEKFVDLSEGYRPRERMPTRTSAVKRESSSSDIGFLGNLASSNSKSSSSSDISWDSDNATPDYHKEKKIKLVKRFLDMTNKIEDLSNQIYHLKQRIELLEKKMKIGYE